MNKIVSSYVYFETTKVLVYAIITDAYGNKYRLIQFYRIVKLAIKSTDFHVISSFTIIHRMRNMEANSIVRRREKRFILPDGGIASGGAWVSNDCVHLIKDRQCHENEDFFNKIEIILNCSIPNIKNYFQFDEFYILEKN